MFYVNGQISCPVCHCFTLCLRYLILILFNDKPFFKYYFVCNRHEEAEQLRDDVKVLEKRLSDKTLQFNEAITTINALREDVADLQAIIEYKDETINDRDETLEQ